MGSFTNTTYTTTIDSLTKAAESKLVNPYYKFSDKKPTSVNYYKQNIKKSTLDQSAQIHYAHISTSSALRYNKILGFTLYGLPQITVDYEVGDNGVEAAAISGDAIVLPNTIEPLPGDFFQITYLKEDVLFKVDGVTPDTLDNGANIYKIEYHLEYTQSYEDIEKQVVAVYNFVAENVGTEYNCLITSETYDMANKLSDLCTQLTNYFKAVFYKSKVQTFVYKYNGIYNFYDPFMIEFLRRNKILSNGDEFFYVAHQTTTEVTFPYDYSKTFFYGIEHGDMSFFKTNPTCTADLITDINSLFINRLEDYYQVNYRDNMPYKTRFQIFDDTMINGINSNTQYGDKNSMYNLLISFLNGESNYITDKVIEQIHNLDMTDNATNFYLIPIYIYILRNYISASLSNNSIIAEDVSENL